MQLSYSRSLLSLSLSLSLTIVLCHLVLYSVPHPLLATKGLGNSIQTLILLCGTEHK